ncbi:MAG: PAS domain-containing sensor histidine kinase [Gemmatimonadaceae bacterium]
MREEPSDRSQAPEPDRLDDERALSRELRLRTRQLERSEARFRDVIERNADAIVVVDGAGTIRFANAAATQLFGKTREALVGTDFGFPVVLGETTEVDLFAGVAPRVAEMRVVRSEWEGSDAFIASLRDVTERKRAEEAAHRLIREQAARAVAERSARRLRFLAESSAVLSSSLDYTATLATLASLCVQEIADWTVIYGLTEDGAPRRMHIAHRDTSKEALARELRGIPIDQQGLHPVLEVLRTRQPRVVNGVTDAMRAAMTSNPRELELMRALHVTSYMLVPIVARDRVLGAISFMCGDSSRHYGEDDLTLAEDVAQRAALAVDNALLYGEASRANQTKSDFLAVVSHDLRTPLTAILGYADLLEMGVPEPIPDASRERVRRIRTSAKHLLYLLNELLSFARLDAGREETRRQKIDLRDIAREVATMIEPLAAERALEFSLDLPEPPVVIDSDPDKLRQILLNLAGNAVKYTKQGRVSMAVRDERDVVELLVSDTGDGIAAEHVAHIFEPFWQVDPSQRLRGGGTGLGLSVVQRLVMMLDGHISVKSAPGEGSVFAVVVPRG